VGDGVLKETIPDDTPSDLKKSLNYVEEMSLVKEFLIDIENQLDEIYFF